MRLSNKGLTLLELLVVVAIMAVISLIAMPSFFQLRQNAQYREAASGISSVLRDARSRAISQNVQHSVCFDVDKNRYTLVSGACPSPLDDNADWVNFSPAVIMRRNTTCMDNTDTQISFNPTGASNAQYICVMTNDTTPLTKFKVGVSHAATGRIVIE